MHSFFFYAVADWQTYKSAVIHADIEKIELFGTDYIFDFISEWVDELKYKLYVTNALKNIIEVTARIGGIEISYNDFFDMLRPKEKEDTPDLSADEIVDMVIQNTGLKIIDDSGGDE